MAVIIVVLDLNRNNKFRLELLAVLSCDRIFEWKAMALLSTVNGVDVVESRTMRKTSASGCTTSWLRVGTWLGGSRMVDPSVTM